MSKTRSCISRVFWFVALISVKVGLFSNSGNCLPNCVSGFGVSPWAQYDKRDYIRINNNLWLDTLDCLFICVDKIDVDTAHIDHLVVDTIYIGYINMQKGNIDSVRNLYLDSLIYDRTHYVVGLSDTFEWQSDSLWLLNAARIEAGISNRNRNLYSGVLSGQYDTITPNSSWSVIPGGWKNVIDSSANAGISSGFLNRINKGSNSSWIGGGGDNNIYNIYTVLCGGSGNTDSSYGGFIGGGVSNIAVDTLSVIVAGYGNYNAGGWAIIGAGYDQFIGRKSHYSGIFSGQRGIIEDSATNDVIGGGRDNAIRFGCLMSGIFSGRENEIDTNTFRSVIAGGYSNYVGSGCHEAGILGGLRNTIAYGTNGVISGGVDNFLYNYANGVGWGVACSVNASYSFAGGKGAKIVNEGDSISLALMMAVIDGGMSSCGIGSGTTRGDSSFLWGDESTDLNADDNTFKVASKSIMGDSCSDSMIVNGGARFECGITVSEISTGKLSLDSLGCRRLDTLFILCDNVVPEDSGDARLGSPSLKWKAFYVESLYACGTPVATKDLLEMSKFDLSGFDKRITKLENLIAITKGSGKKVCSVNLDSLDVVIMPDTVVYNRLDRLETENKAQSKQIRWLWIVIALIIIMQIIVLYTKNENQ